MSLGLILRQAIMQQHKLVLSFGETFGDIPTYSLHRIKNMMVKKQIGIGKELEQILIGCLLEANEKYKKDSGNDWSCLTSNNLTDAIEAMGNKVDEVINNVDNCPRETKIIMFAVKKKLIEKRDANIKLVSNWFFDNYDDLLYIKSGKIPWPIIKKLRAGLALWIGKAANPFREDIEKVILEVAKENGLKNRSADAAWKAMGGKLFTEKD